MDITTIQISKKVKDQLDELKNYEQETYDMILERILRILSEEDSELLDGATLAEIEKSMDEFKEGKYITDEQLRKELSI